MDKLVSRRYFNDKAFSWDETPRGNDPQRLQALSDLLHLCPNDKVLDVGSGTGVFIPYILGKIQGKGLVVCVDFALNMLEISAKKNGSSNNA